MNSGDDSNWLTAVVCIGALTVIAVGFCWLNDKWVSFLNRRRNPPEKLAAQRKEHERRLLNPDWPCYERHLQRPAPEKLRELYADRSLITGQQLEYTELAWIDTFEPLDEAAHTNASEWVKLFELDVMPIAIDDAGDLICLRPGPDEPNTVYITHHDGGETEVFAPTIEEMVSALKRNA